MVMTWDDLDPRGKLTFMLCFVRTVPALVIVLEGVCMKSKVLSFQAQNPSQPTNVWLHLLARPSDSWGCPGGLPSLDSGCVAVGTGTGSQFLELSLVRATGALSRHEWFSKLVSAEQKTQSAPGARMTTIVITSANENMMWG